MALSKSKKKNTGQFDCHVTLQSYVADDSGGGGDGLGGGGTNAGGQWIDETDLWCKIRPVKGYERLSLDAQNSSVDSIIQMRYSDFDIDGESRILFKNRKYNLQYVIDQNEQDCYYEVAASYEIHE